tara:strand:- start:529 stop:750 length:222 start_codon:yes stop_codon:yes gene_type:complete
LIPTKLAKPEYCPHLPRANTLQSQINWKNLKGVVKITVTGDKSNRTKFEKPILSIDFLKIKMKKCGFKTIIFS